MKRLLVLPIFAAAAMACGGTDAPEDLGPPGSVSNPLQAVTITLDLESLAAGQSANATAKARYLDGSNTDKTAEAVWTSSDEAIATVSVFEGVVEIKTKAPGVATIQAVVEAVTGSFDVTVAAPVLTEITVTPAQLVMRVGENVQLVASGTFSDGSAKDVTQEVEWFSQRPTVVNISATGLASSLSLGQSTITAKKDGLESAASASVQCTYPQTGSAVQYGQTLPGLSWTGGFTENGGMEDLDLEQEFCQGSRYDSILFVIGAGWCPNCPDYMRRVNSMAAQLTAANQKIVYLEIETRSRTPASNSDAKHTVDRYIGQDGPGLRVGDADTNPIPMVFSRAVRGVPSAFVVRTSDMKVIASQGQSQYVLNFVGIAQNPNRMW